MKKKNRNILLLTLLPVLCISGVYMNYVVGRNDGELKGKSSIRQYTHLPVKKISFKYKGSQVGIWQEFNERLYILDQVSQQFYVLDREGQILDTLGTKGVAPWDNQQIRRFQVTDEGIYASDNSLMTVKLTGHNGVNTFYRKRQEPFWDAVHLTGNDFLFLNDESELFGFYKWSMDNERNESLIRIDELLGIRGKQNLHVAYEGDMVQGNDFHFYVCARAGKFFVFDQMGEFKGVHPTLDQTEAPEIIERKLNNMTIYERQPDEIINYSAATDGRNLFILSTIAFEPTDEMSVDVYAPDGKYQYSFKLPGHHDSFPMNITMGKNLLWVLYEDMYIIGYELHHISL